jgi:hypothetical protein
MATPARDAEIKPPSHEMFLAWAQELGARKVGAGMRFERASRPFTAVWNPPGKSSPPQLRLTTPAGPHELPPAPEAQRSARSGPYRGDARERIKSPAPLTLRLEGTLDRAGKSLQINREIQTGDAGFDERVYIESEAPDALVLAVLASPRTRASVITCLELGCTEVKLDDKGDLGTGIELKSEDLLAPRYLASVLDALGAAAEAIPPLLGEGHHRTRAGLIPTIAVVGTLASGPLFYLVDLIWEPLGSSLYGAAARGGLVLWAVSLPILFFVLRGRSVSLRDFLTSAIALVVGFPLGSVDLLVTLNGALDTSPPEEHETRVLNMRSTTGKGASTYITMGSWHPGEETIEIHGGGSFYPSLANNQRITVTTRRGFLGWERITAIVPIIVPPPAVQFLVPQLVVPTSVPQTSN